MNLYDLADTLGVDINWSREPEAKEMICFMDNCMIKDDNGVFRASFGKGKTPYDALFDYVEYIRGREIQVNKDKAGHFKVPSTIEKNL